MTAIVEKLVRGRRWRTGVEMIPKNVNINSRLNYGAFGFNGEDGIELGGRKLMDWFGALHGKSSFVGGYNHVG